jgi:chemotaxis protein CheD
MLPDSKIDPVKAVTAPFMFVDSGVPRLFRASYALGAERANLVIKVAGGAQLMDPNRMFNIGERNVLALAKLLSNNGYGIAVQDVGGLSSRTMRFDLATGEVTIHSPGAAPYRL